MLFQIAATIEYAKKSNTNYAFPNLSDHLAYAEKETKFNPNLKCVNHYKELFKNLKTDKPGPKVKKISFPFHYVDKKVDNETLIDGFFQSEKYFKNSRKEMIELVFKNKEKIKKVAVHVRRGDYLKNPACHNNLSKNYYFQAFELFPGHEFLIFSDDIEWCKNTFIGDNIEIYRGKNDLEDLRKMSSCEHNIIANSSFSWWGAWLNTNKNKKIICPSQWVGPNLSHLNTSDIYCDSWIKI